MRCSWTKPTVALGYAAKHERLWRRWDCRILPARQALDARQLIERFTELENRSAQ